jgi:Holliday junction resolvasome RuvABC DNA-binding subunit
MSDLWLIEYERVLDDYVRDINKQGDDFTIRNAEAKARATLKSLGFDPHEIDEQISEMKA